MKLFLYGSTMACFSVGTLMSPFHAITKEWEIPPGEQNLTPFVRSFSVLIKFKGSGFTSDEL